MEAILGADMADTDMVADMVADMVVDGEDMADTDMVAVGADIAVETTGDEVETGGEVETTGDEVDTAEESNVIH